MPAIAHCHHCRRPLTENDRLHLRGAHCYCLECVPCNDGPIGLWNALWRFVGLAFTVLGLCAIAFAGNARSDRSYAFYRQDRARTRYQNQQWAQQFARVRADQEYARQYPLAASSPTARMYAVSGNGWRRWQHNTTPRFTVYPRR